MKVASQRDTIWFEYHFIGIGICQDAEYSITSKSKILNDIKNLNFSIDLNCPYTNTAVIYYKKRGCLNTIVCYTKYLLECEIKSTMDKIMQKHGIISQHI